jgi:hypothetical protein
MKIIREKSRTYKGKPYYKYKINIPEIELKKAGLNLGDEMELKIESRKLILTKK